MVFSSGKNVHAAAGATPRGGGGRGSGGGGESILTPGDNYFPISPDTLNPDALTDFQVYLLRGGRFVLYTKERERFSRERKERLVESGVDTVYIPYHQQSSYENYVFDNLEYILRDDTIPIAVRSRVFLDTTSRQISHVFEKRLPALEEDSLENIRHVVSSSLSFLSTPEAMENIGKFVSHDYQTFTHSVQVFSYAMMLMQALGHDTDERTLIDVGIGAMLHDIGKVHVPKKILNKPGRLNEKEWAYIVLHPVYGMRMSANVAMSQTSLNCIMFHHEKYNGAGYPSGMNEGEIPFCARVVACCDVYDALTSKRPYAPARTAYEALKIMSEEMAGSFDPEVFTAFVRMLGGGVKP